MILVKKIAFFSFYVFGQKQSRNNVWGSFLGYKIGSLDRRIFSYFPKGLTHDGGQEMNFFLFVSKNDLKKMFRDLVDREE